HTRSKRDWSSDVCSSDLPMAPLRLRLTMDLLADLGLLDHPRLRRLEAPVAGEELLTAVHEADYVQAVRDAAAGSADHARGLGSRSEERRGGQARRRRVQG